jgi:hypothetical protein
MANEQGRKRILPLRDHRRPVFCAYADAPSMHQKNTKLCDTVPFVLTYNWRKFLKHAFGYSYKVRCQKRFQQLKD